MNETVCGDCGKVRTDEPEYDPMVLIFGGSDPGWYSGDGELCGPCMVALSRKANRR